MSSPTLYIVATPIGNLDDLTIRAARVLGQVGLIACEDTRRTRKLTNRLGLAAKLISYREHNHAPATAKIIAALERGESVALVSDAGTPVLSDPGARLVEEVAGAGHPITPIPGPSAAATALSVSGFSGDRFSFFGFLPVKASARNQVMAEAARREETLIFYIAPHKAATELAALAEVLGPRQAVLGRELTKMNEEFIRKNLVALAEWAAESTIKGELTLVVRVGEKPETGPVDPEEIRRLVGRLQEEGLKPSKAAAEAARRLGVSRRRAYDAALSEPIDLTDE